MASDSLDERIRSLPPDMQREVEAFVRTLQDRVSDSSGPRRLRLDWAGGLSHLGDSVSSVELQKRALEWWTD